jgi:hypothetical protein
MSEKAKLTDDVWGLGFAWGMNKIVGILLNSILWPSSLMKVHVVQIPTLAYLLPQIGCVVVAFCISTTLIKGLLHG